MHFRLVPGTCLVGVRKVSNLFLVNLQLVSNAIQIIFRYISGWCLVHFKWDRNMCRIHFCCVSSWCLVRLQFHWRTHLGGVSNVSNLLLVHFQLVSNMFQKIFHLWLVFGTIPICFQCDWNSFRYISGWFLVYFKFVFWWDSGWCLKGINIVFVAFPVGAQYVSGWCVVHVWLVFEFVPGPFEIGVRYI